MSRFSDFFRRRRRANEMETRMVDEMRFHLDMAAEQYTRLGMSPDDARRNAALAFGGAERWREAARDEYRNRPREELLQDIRYAMRTLVRSRAFTVAALATLALTSGAATSIYSVVN